VGGPDGVGTAGHRLPGLLLQGAVFWRSGS
jgi:hypothetical protein